MPVKIFKTGNYLVIDDGSEELRSPAKDVCATRKTVGAATWYRFSGFRKLPEERGFNLADIVDGAGAAYAAGAFETFITGNTGA